MKVNATERDAYSPVTIQMRLRRTSITPELTSLFLRGRRDVLQGLR